MKYFFVDIYGIVFVIFITVTIIFFVIVYLAVTTFICVNQGIWLDLDFSSQIFVTLLLDMTWLVAVVIDLYICILFIQEFL